jgi:Iron-sulfur cluster assembly accessory protein
VFSRNRYSNKHEDLNQIHFKGIFHIYINKRKYSVCIGFYSYIYGIKRAVSYFTTTHKIYYMTEKRSITGFTYVALQYTLCHAFPFFVGVRVIIDRKAQLTLLGTEMDYVETKLSSEFVFNNPNIKGTCGCGESFSV